MDTAVTGASLQSALSAILHATRTDTRAKLEAEPIFLLEEGVTGTLQSGEVFAAAHPRAQVRED